MTFERTFDILIVGDDPFQDELKPLFGNTPCRFRAAATAAGTYESITRQRPDLILMRFDAPDLTPFQILDELSAQNGNIPVVMLAIDPPTEAIVKCMQLGVHDFFKYPEDLGKLPDAVQRLCASPQPLLEHGTPDAPAHGLGFEMIIGNCPAIQQVKKTVARLAKLKWVTVLILGETGTGKQVIARAIHEASTTLSHQGRFVEVNCTAIPANLLEAELFGYEKGAFTDAKTRKPGLFELAGGGSLFLDEIGDMSLSLQAKLLKAIEEKRFRRLGGTADVTINTRIIAGTNAALKQAVAAGKFRQDLYYRLNVVNIELPPLRQRREDILLLAKHFLRQFNQAYETAIAEFSAGARDMLLQYYWPGNVRELKHAIERAVLLSEHGVIDEADLSSALGFDRPEKTFPDPASPLHDRSEASAGTLIEIPTEGMSLRDGERRLIEEVLRLTKWNRTKAAEILGISRPRLKRKIDEYQID
jgi:DNA-binding NtrC family response regulator